MRKETDPKYRLYGRTTIWQGCHVRKSDSVAPYQDLISASLSQRLARALFISRVFKTNPLGYCWDSSDEDSKKHFGLIYQIYIDNQHTATDLKKKEFRKQRGHGLAGEFRPVDDLIQNQDDIQLESWSRAILPVIKARV